MEKVQITRECTSVKVVFNSGREFNGDGAELVRFINRLGRTPSEYRMNDGVTYDEWGALIDFVIDDGIAEKFDGTTDDDYTVRLL